MKKSGQTYFLDLISGKDTSPLSTLLRILLFIPSWIYRSVIACRNWAFNRGYFKIHTSKAPLVISIGNIVVGGTGKTPTTLMLAKALGSGEDIAILTRGYRSRAETLALPIVLSRGKGPLYGANYCGDEPYLLARRMPKATVIVGQDRCKASEMALKAGAKMILLDDGMQHRRLARHFDVTVIDAMNPFGHGHMIPRGLLREPPESLSRAHFIVLTHVKDEAHYREACEKLSPFTKSSSDWNAFGNREHLGHAKRENFKSQRPQARCFLWHSASRTVFKDNTEFGRSYYSSTIFPGSLSIRPAHIRKVCE